MSMPTSEAVRTAIHSFIQNARASGDSQPAAIRQVDCLLLDLKPTPDRQRLLRSVEEKGFDGIDDIFHADFTRHVLSGLPLTPWIGEWRHQVGIRDKRFKPIARQIRLLECALGRNEGLVKLGLFGAKGLDNLRALDIMAKLRQELKGVGYQRRGVVILDGLDLCPPGFTLQVLQTVCHGLTVPNTFFVCPASRSMLAAQLERLYGRLTDADVDRLLWLFFGGAT